MSRTVSPSGHRRYPVRLVCEEWGVARSSLYGARTKAASGARVPAKRGPKTRYSDAELTHHIRHAIETSPFTGEGHRKVWARLRAQAIRAGKPRILRLMREANLLAPSRATRVLGPRNHDGTITTEVPDRMWGTDATSAFTLEEGQATVFLVIDHCTAECLGVHVAKIGNRFEALEPLHQAVRQAFGGFGQQIAAGLALRHDHGSQFMSDDYQHELAFLGIESSPAFVRAPEGNGVAERFIRTLKEQLLWVKSFRTVEELRLALHEWAKIYNEHWMIERHAHQSPAAVRRAFVATKAAA